MKCAMLGLKIVKSASLGKPAEWEDEGEAGDPPRRRRSEHRRPRQPRLCSRPAPPRSGIRITAKHGAVGSLTTAKRPAGMSIGPR